MASSDDLWSELDKKYGNVKYKNSMLPKRETISKILGLVAFLICAKAVHDKYREFESSDRKLSELFGETSIEAMIKSSIFGFVFVCTLKLLSDKVVTLTEDVKSKLESSTHITNLPIPTTSMPLVVALLVAEATELFVDNQFSDDVGTFQLGNLLGMITAISVCGLFNI